MLPIKLNTMTGTIQNIQHIKKDHIIWKEPNPRLQDLTRQHQRNRSFSADQFSAQLDEVIIFGTFTQFVVEDNEHVEMIVSDEDYNGLHAKKVIVLKSSAGILHIDPTLAESYVQRYPINIPFWIHILAVIIFTGIVVYFQTWQSLKGAIFLIVMMYLVVGFFLLQKTGYKQDKYKRFELRKAVDNHPMLQGYSLSKLQNDQYYYRTKEFVINLKKLV